MVGQGAGEYRGIPGWRAVSALSYLTSHSRVFVIIALSLPSLFILSLSSCLPDLRPVFPFPLDIILNLRLGRSTDFINLLVLAELFDRIVPIAMLFEFVLCSLIMPESRALRNCFMQTKVADMMLTWSVMMVRMATMSVSRTRVAQG